MNRLRRRFSEGHTEAKDGVNTGFSAGACLASASLPWRCVVPLLLPDQANGHRCAPGEAALWWHRRGRDTDSRETARVPVTEWSAT